MLKKIISTILLVTLMLSLLVGCSNNNGASNGSNNNMASSIEEIVLEYTEITIAIGERFTLNALVFPKSKTEAKLTWESSNNSVAMVNNGTVMGISEGNAIITVSSINGKYAVCRVHVSGILDNNQDNNNPGGNNPGGEDQPGGNNPGGDVAGDKTYTLGMGVVVGFSDGVGSSWITGTAAAVIFDENGKIVDCRLDAAYNGYYFGMDSLELRVRDSKKELGYNYNMSAFGSDNNGDGVVKEWFEQATIFEQYVIGMTADQVKNLRTQLVNNHYISSDDALLNAGCTIQITEFVDAIVKACNDDKSVSFTTNSESLNLGLAIESYDAGSTPAGSKNGSVKIYSDIAATVIVDNKIVATINDCIQPKVIFDYDGYVVENVYYGTYRELNGQIPDDPVEDTNKEYTLGMGLVMGDITNTQIDATIATVVLDKDGRIVACNIDVVKNKYRVGDCVEFTNLLTNKELGDSYGMSAALNYGMDWNGDGVVLEWYLQAQAFEQYVIGKTVEEVKNMGTQVTPHGYIISSDDALLSAGCTIQITAFIEAVVKACYDDQAMTFTTDGEIGLGLGINSYDNGSSGDDFEATVKVNIDFAAVAMVDGKIVAALNDGIQPSVVLEDGWVDSITFKGTKRELKENYLLSAYGPDNNGDGIVLEWYLQSAVFSNYIVGMTPTEIANLATQYVNGHYISTDDALLTAGCTIQITGMQDVVAKAAENAQN